MNRRSFLSFLGLAPVAAPVAFAAASNPPLDYSGLAADVGERLDHTFAFDAGTGSLNVPSLQLQHQTLPEGKMTLKASADNALSERIDSLIKRANSEAIDDVFRRRFGLKAV